MTLSTEQSNDVKRSGESVHTTRSTEHSLTTWMHQRPATRDTTWFSTPPSLVSVARSSRGTTSAHNEAPQPLKYTRIWTSAAAFRTYVPCGNASATYGVRPTLRIFEGALPCRAMTARRIGRSDVAGRGGAPSPVAAVVMHARTRPHAACGTAWGGGEHATGGKAGGNSRRPALTPTPAEYLAGSSRARTR